MRPPRVVSFYVDDEYVQDVDLMEVRKRGRWTASHHREGPGGVSAREHLTNRYRVVRRDGGRVVCLPVVFAFRPSQEKEDPMNSPRYVGKGRS